MDTTLSDEIHGADDKIKYDQYCKRVLSDKHILAYILAGCVKEYQGCNIDDIALKYEDKVTGNVHEPEENYDIVRVVMVCLGKQEDAPNDLLKLLDTLLVSDCTPDEKCKLNPSRYNGHEKAWKCRMILPHSSNYTFMQHQRSEVPPRTV